MRNKRRHLVDVGSTEPLRLLVHVVAADTLKNGSNLQRFERLPLLKKGTLENSASHMDVRSKKEDREASPDPRARSP